jgi:drug/metabolite transporter (DMT)-like permease
MVLVATACYGWSANIIKAHLQQLNAVQITTLSLIFIGPWAGIYLFTAGNFVEVMQSHPKAWSSLGYIAVLAITCSVLSVIAFNELIKMTNALFATSCTYIIPFVAILWGVLDNETITVHQLTGFAIIIAGIYLVNKR